MSDERLALVRRLFEQAAQLPVRQRAAFLSRECVGNPQLLAEVQALLDADQRENSAVDLCFSQLTTLLSRQPEPDPLPFDTCGDYRLVRRLGGGGMGEVFLAERIDNGNLVAIKVLKRESGSVPDIVSRFEREKELLGRLQHPNIARFYHSGIESDRLWFAMDYIEDHHPIDAYCKTNNLPLRARLKLMGKLCAAVVHAHGKFIAHCDLTPNNVLVTPDGEPHLVDFGIARTLSEAPGAPRLTSGSRPYSVDYASPEQIKNKPLDAKTDSWSLGAILYTLLVGQPPFVADGILSDRIIEDKILNDEPLPPSVAASSHGVLSSFASPSDWKELDTLCLWALRKEPENRCRVDQLGDDIGRFLRTEPLQARPAGWRYISGKFLRRKKAWVIAATIVFVFIAGLVAFSSRRVAHERDNALAEARRTRLIQRFMLNMLGAGDKEAAPSNELRVVSLLDRGAREAATLNSDPETQAELYENLGRMYRMLGKFQQADNLMRLGIERMKMAVGPENPKVADDLIDLGLSRGDQAQFKDAERLIREGLSLASRHLPPGDPAVLRAKSALGVVLSDSGSYDQAIALLDPLVKLQPGGQEDQYILVDSLPALASAEADTGHLDIAESLDRRALALDRQLLGNSHPRVGDVLAEIARFKANRGQFPEAEALYRESIEIYKAWYGPNHTETAAMTSVLALVLTQDGKYVEALPLLQQVLPIQEQAYGEVHPYVAVTLDALGTQELNRGDLAAAQMYAERAVKIDRTLFGDADHQTAVAKAHLAQVFIKREQYDRAEPILREVVNALTERPQPGNMAVGGAQALLGRVLLREKRYLEAEEHLTAAYAIFANRPLTMLQKVREDLAELYTVLHRPEKAAEFRAELAAGAKSRQ
jgi:tetratricopeptide (TPR) repeat protein